MPLGSKFLISIFNIKSGSIETDVKNVIIVLELGVLVHFLGFFFNLYKDLYSI